MKILERLLEFFRTVQTAHTKLLRFLEKGIIYSNLDDTEVSTFLQGKVRKLLHSVEYRIILVLELLREVTDELAGMNIKSLVDGWKCYMSLVQGNISILKIEHFPLETVFTSLNNEICVYLDLTLLHVLFICFVNIFIIKIFVLG